MNPIRRDQFYQDPFPFVQELWDKVERQNKQRLAEGIDKFREHGLNFDTARTRYQIVMANPEFTRKYGASAMTHGFQNAMIRRWVLQGFKDRLNQLMTEYRYRAFQAHAVPLATMRVLYFQQWDDDPGIDDRLKRDVRELVDREVALFNNERLRAAWEMSQAYQKQLEDVQQRGMGAHKRKSTKRRVTKSNRRSKAKKGGKK